MIHSLPICRIEADRFVPRFSAFFIFYYAHDPEPIQKRKIDENLASGQNDPEYFPSITPAGWRRRGYSEEYDLPLWVARRKLFWLDPQSPSLDLKTGSVEDFPYTGIEGYQRPFTLRQGKIEFGL